VYLVPNLVTTAALLLGFWSIILSIEGHFQRAATCIVLAAVFDMLDGRIARATKATSSFGIEYDSLSDLVSFGMAPALLVYQWALAPLGSRGWLLSALFALCAALRLARFNVRAHVQDSPYYQGLPSTLAGGMVALGVWFVAWLGLEPPFGRATGALITCGFVALALLMVSGVPYPSLKLVKVPRRRAYPTLVGVVLLAIAVLLNHEWLPFLLGVAFLVSGPPYAWRRRRLIPEPPLPAADGPTERADA
jgi:CDP-diacylglycerol--serine O-phosphatidyltransferase